VGRWNRFTSINVIKTLKGVDVQISMNGKSGRGGQRFFERIWQAIKYKEICPRAYDRVLATDDCLRKCLAPYNSRRQHSSLDGQTPDHAYSNPPPPIPIAA
jgi:putative transposase